MEEERFQNIQTKARGTTQFKIYFNSLLSRCTLFDARLYSLFFKLYIRIMHEKKVTKLGNIFKLQTNKRKRQGAGAKEG